MSARQQASWLPLVCICLVMSMIYFTSLGTNVVISKWIETFDTDIGFVQLVIMMTSLIGGGFMLLTSKLGEKFGKKKILATGIVIYLTGLVTALISPTQVVFFVGWAIIWPIGMVMIIPTTIALILYFYRDVQRAQALGIYGAVTAVVSAASPLIVGAIADMISWRFAFIPSVVLGVMALLFTFKFEETPKEPETNISLLGVVLSGVTFIALLFGSSLAAQYGWLLPRKPFELAGVELPLSIGAIVLALSVLFFALFVKYSAREERRGLMPLMQPGILKNKKFIVGLVGQSLFFIVVTGVVYGTAVLCQQALGMSSLETALTSMPYTVAAALFALSTPSLGVKVVPRYIIIGGLGIMFLGITKMLFELDATEFTWMSFIVSMTLIGVGTGIVMAQITNVMLSTLSEAHYSDGAGFSETMKELMGQGIAVALTGALLFGGWYFSMSKMAYEIESPQKEVSVEIIEQAALQHELDLQRIGVENEYSEYVVSLPKNIAAQYADMDFKSAIWSMQSLLKKLLALLVIVAAICWFLPKDRLGGQSA